VKVLMFMTLAWNDKPWKREQVKYNYYRYVKTVIQYTTFKPVHDGPLPSHIPDCL
jgi:hypothetical protein